MEGDDVAHYLDGGGLGQGVKNGGGAIVEQGVENGVAGMENGAGGIGHGMPNGDAALDQGVEDGEVVLEHQIGDDNDEVDLEDGIENGEGGLGLDMGNGDTGLGQAVENGGADVEPGVENGIAEAGMENGVGGIGHGMPNGDAVFDQGVEDGEFVLDHQIGDDNDEFDLEDEMGNGEGGLGIDMENGDAGLGHGLLNGDAIVIEQDMEDGEAVDEQGMEDADADLEQAMEDADAGIDQDMLDAAAAVPPQYEALPPCVPEYEASQASLPLQWGEFQQSGPPQSIVLLGDRDEEDGGGDAPQTVGLLFRHGGHRRSDTVVPDEIMGGIREAFDARNALIEAVLPDGRRIVLNFLRKVAMEVDAQGAVLKTLATYWVDPQLRVHVDGSLRPNWERVDQVALLISGGERACGHGIHVSPLRRIKKSAMLSLLGAMNEHVHMLLCAMAPGFKEDVPAGSLQEQPSNPMYHSGVGFDTPPTPDNPAWYVFWQGIDVLPLYIVTFTLAPPPGQG